MQCGVPAKVMAVQAWAIWQLQLAAGNFINCAAINTRPRCVDDNKLRTPARLKHERRTICSRIKAPNRFTRDTPAVKLSDHRNASSIIFPVQVAATNYCDHQLSLKFAKDGKTIQVRPAATTREARRTAGERGNTCKFRTTATVRRYRPAQA